MLFPLSSTTRHLTGMEDSLTTKATSSLMDLDVHQRWPSSDGPEFHILVDIFYRSYIGKLRAPCTSWSNIQLKLIFKIAANAAAHLWIEAGSSYLSYQVAFSCWVQVPNF